MKSVRRSTQFCALILCLAGAECAFAVTYPMYVSQRLSGVIVRQIIEDSRGFIWVVSDSGIWRWDEVDFELLNSGSSTPAIRTVEQDSQGTLWFASDRGTFGLNVWQPYGPPRWKLLDEEAGRCLHLDLRGRMWVGTLRGLFELIYRDGGVTAVAVPGTENHEIFALASDSNGTLWAGGKRVLLRFQQDRVERVHDSEFAEHEIVALRVAPDNSLWIGCRRSGGLFQLSGDHLRRITFEDGLPCDDVNTIDIDRQNRVWFGTEMGVYSWNGSGFTVIDQSNGLASVDVHSIFVDSNQRVWIGMYGGGVSCLRSVDITIYNLKDGLQHPVISALADHGDGRMLVGTIERLQIFNPADHSWQWLLPRIQANALLRTNAGEVWVAGFPGFARAGDSEVIDTLRYVCSLAEEDDGALLLATPTGLYRYQDGLLTRIYTTDDKPLSIAKVMRSHDGALWLATASGVIVRPRGPGSEWIRMLPDQDVTAICEHPKDKMLVAAEGTVLRQVGSTFVEDLPPTYQGKRVFDMAVDGEGTVWAATHDGLLRRDSRGWVSLGVRNGLPSRDLRAVFCHSSGILYVGTLQGLVRIDPAHLDVELESPRVYIRQVLTPDQEWISGSGPLTLPYSRREMMVETRVLGFADEGPLQFQYRLEGRDADWGPPTQMTLQNVRALSPGDYRFMVRAITPNGRSGPVESFSLVVQMPLWQRAWFVSLCIVAFTGLCTWLLFTYRRRFRLFRVSEAAVRAKSEFVSRMSHEIRTPLTVILANAERLSDVNLSEGARQECAGAVFRHGRHLLQLVNDLLDLSQIRGEKLSIHRGPCNVADVLQDIRSLATPQASAKGLRFDIVLAPEVPPVILTDALKLRQLLINLVDNAIKFTETGFVAVSVEAVVDAGRSWLRISVEDTGIGIAESEIESIFEAFHQIDPSRRRRYGGSGLGLTISRAIGELLGGTLRVQSALGQGSTFVIEIPLVPVNAGDKTAEWTSKPPPDASALRNLRILVADDCEDILRVVTEMLKEAGAHVAAVSRGDQVVPTLRANRFDAVFMDIHMPDVDGIRIMRRLRRFAQGIPVIAISADITSKTRAKCKAAGFNGFVSKPFGREDVLEALRQLTNGSPATQDGKHRPAGHMDTIPKAPRTRTEDDGHGPIQSSLAEHSTRLAEAAAEFAVSLGTTVSALEAAASQEEVDVLASIAHRLKGSGGVNGYMCISEAASALESAVRKRDLASARAQIAAIEQLRRRMIAGLQGNGTETIG